MAKKRLSAFDEKWLTMKRTTAKNGDVFIPIRTYLGTYYLRFHKVNEYEPERGACEHFVVSRINELKDDGGIFICEAHKEEVRSAYKDKAGFWMDFKEMEVIIKMTKKLK